MRRRPTEFLRRMARRYVVTRRGHDALADRYNEAVVGRDAVTADRDELLARHEKLTEAAAQLEADFRELAQRHTGLQARHDEIVAAKDLLEATYRTWTPPGHFYSPHPDPAEVRKRAETIFDRAARPLGVDLREPEQLALLDELAPLLADLPFTARPDGEHRYFFDNPEYSWSDGLVLHAMLRRIRPRRIVEVGSGYSSAMMLDTVDGWLDGATELTFVEPHPQNLRALLRPTDADRVTVLERPVQDVPMSVFTALEPGDVLFIDSTHVVKAGSDVNFLFFEVLPRLPAGVWIHVHDIFYPFEYPMDWVLEGRAWQEAYLLRAFLMFNSRFELHWYQQFIWSAHRDLLLSRVPAMAGNPGGNVWLRTVRPAGAGPEAAEVG